MAGPSPRPGARSDARAAGPGAVRGAEGGAAAHLPRPRLPPSAPPARPPPTTRRPPPAAPPSQVPGPSSRSTPACPWEAALGSSALSSSPALRPGIRPKRVLHLAVPALSRLRTPGSIVQAAGPQAPIGLQFRLLLRLWPQALSAVLKEARPPTSPDWACSPAGKVNSQKL
ncbi:unnamed protein product [Rangifer tarandus platyrhynchus]|uniref:Uncharacterized protein n=1 Tax=Rangifer tarandus platyrhynchus TaxID=3082113 RepID=A0AC59ZW35_RANTA